VQNPVDNPTIIDGSGVSTSAAMIFVPIQSTVQTGISASSLKGSQSETGHEQEVDVPE